VGFPLVRDSDAQSIPCGVQGALRVAKVNDTLGARDAGVVRQGLGFGANRAGQVDDMAMRRG